MISSAPFLIFFFGKGSGGCQQLLEPKNEGFPTVASNGENPGIHADRIHGTGFNTVTAINTLKQVYIEFDRHFFRFVIQSFPGLNHDAVGRTVRLAHKTGNTFNRLVLMGCQSMPTAPAGRDLRLHLRIVANVQLSVIGIDFSKGGQRLWPFP